VLGSGDISRLLPLFPPVLLIGHLDHCTSSHGEKNSDGQAGKAEVSNKEEEKHNSMIIDLLFLEKIRGIFNQYYLVVAHVSVAH
jgi:hypothetical protein